MNTPERRIGYPWCGPVGSERERELWRLSLWVVAFGTYGMGGELDNKRVGCGWLDA